jgi:hypothetical protein
LSKSGVARDRSLPECTVGAVLGAIGTLAMLPWARRFSVALSSPIHLPGAEEMAGDVKVVTYAETALLVIGIPIAALLFGRVIPGYLERRARPGRISFEWAAAGFAASLPLWIQGLRPKWALGAGTLLSIAIAGLIAYFRASFGFRRLWTRTGRRAALSLASSAAAAALAWRAGPSPRTLLIRNLTMDLIAVVMVVLILGYTLCILFPRPLGGLAGLERMGKIAAISLVPSATSLIVQSDAGVFVPVALLAPLASVGVPLRMRWSRGISICLAALFLFCCGWTIYRQPAAGVDLFEDGHALAPAQQYLLGGRPYLDSYPVHGWGDDGGVDAFFFRIFGSSLQTFRDRRAAWTALSLATLGVSIICSSATPGGVIAAMLVVLGICPWLSERQLLALAALAFLGAGARTSSRRPILWWLGGVCAGAAIFFSLDIGVIVAFGALIAVVTLPSAEARRLEIRAGLRGGAWVLSGIACGGLPFVLRLWRMGVLAAFLHTSFVELPREIVPTWGLPAGSVAALFRQETVAASLAKRLFDALSGRTMPWLFFVLVLAAGGAVLLWRAAAGRLEQVDRAAWMWACVGTVGLRGMLGRADGGHAALYGVFPAVLASWLLLRAFRSNRWVAPTLCCGAFLLIRIHPIKALETQLNAVASSARTRARLEQESVTVFRTERAMLPAGQAGEIGDLKAFLDSRLKPGETFFDFSNEPALYFLLDRSMPVRFLAVPCYETPEKQREVTFRLEQLRPPIAILSSGTWLDAFDGVASRERAPLVAAYLDVHYREIGRVSRWTIGQRR